MDVKRLLHEAMLNRGITCTEELSEVSGIDYNMCRKLMRGSKLLPIHVFDKAFSSLGYQLTAVENGDENR